MMSQPLLRAARRAALCAGLAAPCWLATAPVAGAQTAPPAPAPVDVTRLPSATLPPELDRVLREYEQAWRRRDAAALAALFTDDGLALPDGRPPAQGAAALRAVYARVGGPLALRALRFARDADTAWIVGAWSEAGDGPDLGKFVLALRRDAQGRWRIAADIDNANRVAPPPEPEAAPVRQPASAPR